MVCQDWETEKHPARGVKVSNTAKERLNLDQDFQKGVIAHVSTYFWTEYYVSYQCNIKSAKFQGKQNMWLGRAVELLLYLLLYK